MIGFAWMLNGFFSCILWERYVEVDPVQASRYICWMLMHCFRSRPRILGWFPPTGGRSTRSGQWMHLPPYFYERFSIEQEMGYSCPKVEVTKTNLSARTWPFLGYSTKGLAYGFLFHSLIRNLHSRLGSGSRRAKSKQIYSDQDQNIQKSWWKSSPADGFQISK